MAPVAATNTNSIIAELNRLNPDDWTPAMSERFTREAIKVRNVALAEGDMLLGLIASYNANVRELHKRFKNAMALQPDNYSIIANYGRALFNCGCFGPAIQLLSGLEHPGYKILEILAKSCHALGLESKANHYHDLAENSPGYSPDGLHDVIPATYMANAGLNTVWQSMEKDRKIWASLSMR